MVGKKHTCKYGNNMCKIDKTVRYFCRSCRFEKCLKAGMKPDKIQKNRDPISSTIPSTSSENPEIRQKYSKLVKQRTIDGPLYNLDELMAEIREIFREQIEDYHFWKLSDLKKMEYGLIYIRRNQKRDFLEVSSTMCFDDLTKARCSLIKSAAKWLSFLPAFDVLTEIEKLLVLKSTWHIWARLERLSMTVEMFGEKTFKEKIVFTSSSDVIHLIDVVKFNLKDLSEKEYAEVDVYLRPLYKAIFDELAVKLEKLKPSNVEISFMLCQIVWCVAGKTLKGASLKAWEDFIDKTCSNLHDYYQEDLKIENYAERLLKMMSVVKTMQKTYIDYQRVMGQAENFPQIVKEINLK